MKQKILSGSMKKGVKNHIIINCILLFSLLLMSGCEDYLEVDFPNGQLTANEVFENEATARAAVNELYAKLRESTLLTGISTGMSVSLGLYADELEYYSTPGEILDHFYNHTILSTNTGVTALWNNSYQLIYMANAIIDGIDGSHGLQEETANSIKGEALFIRALAHFYLVNLYGDIPYITTTDYTINSQVERETSSLVYENIVTDLITAKTLLPNQYQTPHRIIPNKAVVSALLAKVYLYIEQWALAETESSILIDNIGTYAWVEEPENVFLKESTTTIWQLAPQAEGNNTHEASSFIFQTSPPPLISLREELIGAFEPEDLRRVHWIAEISDGGQTFYHAYKYKQNDVVSESLEYSIIFRMAEQYLIRAEARLKQGNIIGAQDDLNKIRVRAGLPITTAMTQEELKQAILDERRVEMFTEHGNRWFDIRRHGVVGEILSPIKPGWSPTNILLPIPEYELLINPNLLPQNPGY